MIRQLTHLAVLAALVICSGNVTAADITITNIATLTDAQQKLLNRVVLRMNTEAVTRTTAQHPSATVTTNAQGLVRWRDAENVVLGSYRLSTVPDYALLLMDANSLRSTIAAERAAKNAAIAALYDASDDEVKSIVDAALKAPVD